ncbi:ferric enterobactin uptake receptor [Helicobacter didelphidarum]|uniref:Ferric enterobactin uptake receptor n=1 Tax=Helicobacter didelphidarum TaxID=2040648 RepID=A0A3D8I650_9HELI|nr:ferric enterobactin uptake receptor [Helicobacter didelphidarum]
MTTTVSTASGYEQDIKQAPASISIIPKEEILSRPIRDLGDAVQDVPGVYVEASKTGANTISMRGLDSSYTLILIDGKRQNVAQGFDGQGISANTSFMPPASMIERIEVIRGPASIIYGSDAMGGVINIITKKNIKKTTASIQLETKLHEKYKVFGNIYGINAYLAAPLIKDKLSMNLRGNYKYGDQNSFLKPADILANQTGTSAANPYLGWSATGFHNANLGARFTYLANKYNSFYFDAEGYFGRLGSLNTSGRSVTAIRDFYKTNLILNHDANYEWGKITTYLQYTQTSWMPHSGVPIGGSVGTSLTLNQTRDNKDIIFQSNYNHLFDFNKWGELAFNGGIYYMYEKLSNQSSSFERAMNQFALFAEAQYNINDYVGTTLGLRYNYSDIFKSIPNPRFYINVNPTQWFTIKAGIASGVRVPNLSYLYNGWSYATDGTGTLGNTNLQPESSWNYELGMILDTDYIMAITTGYYTDFRNQIETIPYTDNICSDLVNCRTYRNLDKSLMSGVEFNFRIKPIYGFSLDANYAFTYTEVLSAQVGQEHLVGESINSIPRHSFVITPKYNYKDFDIYLRWNGKFQTPTPAVTGTSAGNLDSARGLLGKYYKDYQIVDIAASYKFFKHYILTFAINNLLDVNFIDLIPYGSNGINPPYTNVINSFQRILPSRNYWITFRMDF